MGLTTVQEAEESQQRPEITQLRIVGREDFSPCLLEILARQTYLNCRSCHIQFIGIALHQLDRLGNAGQTHLNSDAKIADEGRPQGGGGRPQGAPLPIVFFRRYALGRAPTRGAPTDSPCPGEGTYKGCPYQLSSLGVMPWGGHPQGAPLPIRHALGRAPTRGAPTDSPCPGEGTHKGRPYRFAMPWGGHPQGAPLPIRPCPGEGTHKGRPYRFAMPWGGHPQGAPLPIRHALGRAPTRGAPTDSPCPGEGTHKGRPYRFAMPWGGHPQGAPLPIRHALGRAPTRGAPTDCLLSALSSGEGAHKGRPYQLSFFGVMPWWRAPTRGAPTRFRQPHVVFSQLDAIALLGNPLGLPRNCEMWYIEPTTPTATACQVSCNFLPIIPLATLECESRKERRSIFSRLRSVPSIMVQCTTLSGQGRPISRPRAPFQSQFHPHRSTSTFLLSAHGAVPFRFADARRVNPMHGLTTDGLTTDGLTTEGLYQCW